MGTDLVVIVSIAGFVAIKTISQAYLPMLFPGIILLTAVSLNGFSLSINSPGRWQAERSDAMTPTRWKTEFITWTMLIFISISNSTHLITFLNKDQVYTQRLLASKQIVTEAKGKEYNLKWRVPDKKLENYTQNYEYLTWWLGHAPSKKKVELEFIIYEDENGIRVSSVIARP